MRIEVYLTAKEFCRFSTFDSFRRRKMWRSPAIFAAIMSVSALICFLMHHVDGAIMLGTVLLLVGLGMPTTYFILFFHSLYRQIRQQSLPRTVYTLTLTDTKEFHIENETEKVDYPWKKVHHVYRRKLATYLYVTPAKAFILPHYFVEGGAEALWKQLSKKLPKEKLTIL